MIVHYQDFWNTTASQPAIKSQHFSSPTEPVTNICLLKILKPYLSNYIKEKIIHNNCSIKNVDKKEEWISKPCKELWNEITSVAFFKNGITFRCDSLMSNNLLSQPTVVCEINNFQKTHTLKGEILVSKLYHPTPVATSYNEKYIATAMVTTPEQNVVKLWEIDTEKEISFYGKPGCWARINAVAFAPNLPYLISGGQDLNVVIWDIKSNCQIKKIRAQNVIFSIAVSHTPLGKLIIACGQNKGRITAWNLENPWNLEYQDYIYQIPAHDQQVNSLAFSPQGDILASGSQDKVIKLWNSTTGELISTLGYHLNSVNSIAFSPDGQILASASDDKTIKLWDVYRGKEIAELKGHTKAVTSVSFSSDGRTLVSGSKDKTIRLWQRLS
ncbi:MAG: WD40 repeat domain-containing protein [Nostocaceae cyanobacterium]|nr:WD40 repeat domain-containing protein [Nostocaceae cyanobacterium]